MGIFLQSLGLQTLDAPVPADYQPPAPVPPSRSTVSAPTLQSALSLPVIYRAVQIHAGMGAQLPLIVRRNGEQIPTPALIRQPDPWRSLASFVKRYIINMFCDGNAFLLKTTDDKGRVIALSVLNSLAVEIKWKRTDDGRHVKTYDYSTADGKTITYADAEVHHVWGLEIPGLDRGIGPVTACRLSISGALDTRGFANNWFRAGHTPPGTLTTDQPLDKPVREEYKKVWHESSADEIRVLGKGLTYTPIMLKPEDAQWIEAQNFQILDLARLTGLPADYVLAAVEGSSLTYQNGKQIDARFLRTSLLPDYLAPLEDALSTLMPYGQTVHFDDTAFLRPDPKERADIDAIYMTAGVYDAAYVRERDSITGPAPKPATPPAAKEESEA